jgi:2-haloacid dehalogenase
MNHLPLIAKTLLDEGEIMHRPAALFFDIFGTIVDWRSGIARQSAAILAPLGYHFDWIAFAEAWRNEYQPSMEKIRSGRQPFRKLDSLHRQNLTSIAERFGLHTLDAGTAAELTKAWHRLDAWPDVFDAFRRLRPHFLLAPVSNGNISLMVALARHNDLRFDAILGAEIARNYKPNPHVYRAAAEALDLPPAQCMMVAAHSSDLAAAADLGFMTAHIARPHEYGPGLGETVPTIAVDLAATGLGALADELLLMVNQP